ncbi:MAG: restriction endonuclease subunit S [Lachnospiraceae bacterium]|nr:restriction endonuclease subunit S [Lachnospiraceae bacterium]
MKGKSNTPAIRFKGFSDDWELRKLGECFTERKESMPDGELISVTIGEGIKKFSELGRHDNSNDDKSKYKKVCIGDIAYNSMRMWQGASGYSPFEGIVSPAYTVLSPNTDIVDSKCISYLFKRSDMTHVFQINSQGITSDNWNLKYPALSEIKISVSPYLEEQHQIASYLSSFDNLITLHQRKLEKLQNIKKSMLEKMFPQNGSNVPEIRFKGFTDVWEQRKFFSVFEGLQNNTLSRADLNYENGTVKNVHYGDVMIKFGDYIDASETDLPYISDDAKADKFKNSFLQDGDIIIADTAEDDTVGKCTEIQGSEGLKLLSGLHTIACRPKEKYGPMFLGYYINSPAYHNQLKPLMQGIKVTSISKSALQDTDMIMPKSIEEQTMIGEYFANLDNLITLHQRKLEKLQNIKKSMLEKMFV